MTAPAGLWGGRFEGGSDPLFRRFNDSLPVDRALWREDIRGSVAWARALAGAGILSARERDDLTGALADVAAMIERDESVLDRAKDEDIHSFVERELIERVGDLGRKLHTGRSRNDQVATDLRLWAMRAADERMADLRGLEAALLELAARAGDTNLPGYTHLQRAQPVLAAHWCLAYVEMLRRDMSRFDEARRRASVCPLGSGALAGTSFPVDREAVARELGFDSISANSLDAVSDRDFVLDALSACSLVALHLSRLAEDLIVYSTAEFGLVEMSDAVTSGSSLMPQKKNPDAMELIRGKTGRIVGALMGLMMTVKGAPLAYNKDLQEDKAPLFAAMEELSLCLRMAARALSDMVFQADVCRQAAAGGYSNATALAYHLVERGVPFRTAHELTGRLVRLAISKGLPLEKLTIADLQSIAPMLDERVYDRLSLEAVVGTCDVPGGTAPSRVQGALDVAKARAAGSA